MRPPCYPSTRIQSFDASRFIAVDLTYLLFLILTAFLSTRSASAQENVIGLESDRWNLVNAESTDLFGRPCLSGAAYLSDVAFQNGVIEVDVAVDGSRSYPGLIFRMESEQNYERIYVRPHRAGLYPDAVQYTPVINGMAGWQLYNGEGSSAGAQIPAGEWIHLKLEVNGEQARLFIGDNPKPALVITDLKHGISQGTVGVLGPRNTTACFSNFSYAADEGLAFEQPPEVETPPGTLMDWEISRVYPAQRVNRDDYPNFYAIFLSNWQKVTPEKSGLVDIARYHGRTGQDPDLVLARTVVRSDEKQEITLDFGYSDEVDLFLNGKKVFSGNSAYQHRDPSFLGIVGLNDAVHVTLEKGLNEILMMVTETFGGWGFTARAEPELERPLEEHGRVTKAWETPKEFLTPESVLYDPEREILYVSSFDYRYGATPDFTGYISKVALDGVIEELNWVSDLNAPTGMGIHDERLYTTERGVLTEIDLETGAILNRYPIPDSDFLNDLVIDADGSIYMSDTRPSLHVDSRIFRFKDGAVEVWLDGEEIVRANGLFIHEGELLVGNSGDGMLKAVNLSDKSVRSVVCLGAGIIDGIRVDNRGNYIVSHWEGQTYVISPAGEVVEVLDTMGEGVNSADFEYIRGENLLIIPTFLDNRVLAYHLTEH
jgi:sugar lactone lactonase YvrE